MTTWVLAIVGSFAAATAAVWGYAGLLRWLDEREQARQNSEEGA